MPYQYHTADVFTASAFGGNQLAVLPDARGLNTEQMAAIAREFNYSETVFVLPPDDPAHTRKVRIFTPAAELPFAGHPTVGAAFVLAATGEIQVQGDETRIVLEEGVGPVPVLIVSRNGRPVFSQLTAAKIPEKGKESYDVGGIAAMLSLESEDIDAGGDSAIEAWSAGFPFLFVPLRTRDALAKARIKTEEWEQTLRGKWAEDVFLFVEHESSAPNGGVRDGNGTLRARMFGPGVGMTEDPATGGASAAFAGYLSTRSTKRDGTLKWTIHQGVEMGRPSRIEVESDITDGVVEAVRVGGATVLVSSGVLHVV